MWEYWCKAMGSKAYDDDDKANKVAILRTACLAIIIHNTQKMGWW
jgi:hypothetical protein